MLIDISKGPGYTALVNVDHVIKVEFRYRFKDNDKKAVMAYFHMTDGSVEEFEDVHPHDIRTKLMTVIPASPGYKLISINQDFENPNDHEDIFSYNDVVAFAVDNEDYGLRPLSIDDFSNDKDDNKLILTPDKQVVAQGNYSQEDFELWKKRVIEDILAKRAGTKTYSLLID